MRRWLFVLLLTVLISSAQSDPLIPCSSLDWSKSAAPSPDRSLDTVHWYNSDHTFNSNGTLQYLLNGTTYSPIIDLNETSNLYTTLRVQTKLINSMIYDKYTRFCSLLTEDSPQCPLAANDTFQISITTHSGHTIVPLVDVSTRFVLLSPVALTSTGNETTNRMACAYVISTPSFSSNITSAILFSTFGLAILLFLVNFMGLLLSGLGFSRNIYMISASLIGNQELVRLITPGLTSFMKFLQFIVLIGSIPVRFPGYWNNVMRSLAWTVLFPKIFYDVDNDNYDGYYGGGLMTILDTQLVNLWPLFMRNLLIFSALIIVIGEFLIFLSWIKKKLSSSSSSIDYSNDNINNNNEKKKLFPLIKKKLCFIAGLLIRIWYQLFSLPFLTFIFYSLSTLAFKSEQAQHNVPAHFTNWSRHYDSSKDDLNDGELSTAYSAIMIVVLVLWSFLILFYHYFYVFNSTRKYELSNNINVILIWGSLYNNHRDASSTSTPSTRTHFNSNYLSSSSSIRSNPFAFSFIEIVFLFLRSIFLGTIRNPLVQLSLLIINQFFYIISILIIQPYESSTSQNLIHSLLSTVEFILLILLIPLISTINSTNSVFNAIAIRDIIGYVILGLCALTLLIIYGLHIIQVIVELIFIKFSSSSRFSNRFSIGNNPNNDYSPAVVRKREGRLGTINNNFDSIELQRLRASSADVFTLATLTTFDNNGVPTTNGLQANSTGVNTTTDQSRRTSRFDDTLTLANNRGVSMMNPLSPVGMTNTRTSTYDIVDNNTLSPNNALLLDSSGATGNFYRKPRDALIKPEKYNHNSRNNNEYSIVIDQDDNNIRKISKDISDSDAYSSDNDYDDDDYDSLHHRSKSRNTIGTTEGDRKIPKRDTHDSLWFKKEGIDYATRESDMNFFYGLTKSTSPPSHGENNNTEEMDRLWQEGINSHNRNWSNQGVEMYQQLKYNNNKDKNIGGSLFNSVKNVVSKFGWPSKNKNDNIGKSGGFEVSRPKQLIVGTQIKKPGLIVTRSTEMVNKITTLDTNAYRTMSIDPKTSTTTTMRKVESSSDEENDIKTSSPLISPTIINILSTDDDEEYINNKEPQHIRQTSTSSLIANNSSTVSNLHHFRLNNESNGKIRETILEINNKGNHSHNHSVSSTSRLIPNTASTSYSNPSSTSQSHSRFGSIGNNLESAAEEEFFDFEKLNDYEWLDANEVEKDLENENKRKEKE